MKILSVDDNVENRHLLEALLGSSGYTVVSARNGIEALEQLGKEPFDAIISDLLMPKMDGFQLLRECKKDPALRKVPFIIYTATYTGKRDIEFGLSLGAVRYLIKPTEPDEFLAMVREVLDGISTGTIREAVPEITCDAAYAEEHIRVLTDKTEKKDRALEGQREQYRLLAENVSDVIWLLDVATGRYVYVSPSIMTLRGYTPEEVMAQPVGEAATPESNQLLARDLPDQIARFEAGDDTMRVRRHEIDQLGKDGAIVPTESVITLLAGPDRRVTRILGVTRDITERKRAAMQIALTGHKLALMNDVTYQDIQNKVTALRGYAQLLREARTDGERSAFIGKAEDILAQIHRLIKNTKEYQEMGLDQPRWIPIETAIRTAAAYAGPGPTVRIDTDLHGLELYADPLVEKIFFYLIDNAMVHGRGLSRIRFSCAEVPDGLVLVCEDDGAGIDPQKRATLFSRFTGDMPRFGLFFVSEYLALAGMSIRETSRPGEGARFEITVPRGMWRMDGATV